MDPTAGSVHFNVACYIYPLKAASMLYGSATFILLALAYTISYNFFNAPLDDTSLASDLASVRQAFDVEFLLSEKELFTTGYVESYYSETTDNALLELLMGTGMHTRLDGMQQAGYVMHEIATVQAQTVLEVGSGKGHCSLYLARVLHGVQFTGLDLLQRHIQVATAAIGDRRNITFVRGDAGDLSDEPYDIIFGVESLCHMDTAGKLQGFVRQAAAKLNAGGRLIIIDGFRSATFQWASADQQLAMQLAEAGFRIRKMPSRADWIAAGEDSGLVLVSDYDLTDEALPFWTLGWRISRAVFRVPYFVRWLASVRPQTAANLLAAAMTAHALRDSAEYGVLVFEKSSNREASQEQRG